LQGDQLSALGDDCLLLTVDQGVDIIATGDPQIETGDSVFGVKDSLIKRFEPQPAGTPTPDGRDLSDQAWARTRFDVILAPANI